MILPLLIVMPIACGLLALYVGRRSAAASRWVALIALGVNFVLALVVWAPLFIPPDAGAPGPWLAEFSAPWIPQLGASVHLAADGLSVLLLALTALMGIAAVVASWREIDQQAGFFHFNLLWALAGITGVFLALDLFLFYFFWELMLVPMYLLFLWGGERRGYAALKFFIFTQAGGLLMLLAILGLYLGHGQSTGSYTFDYPALLGTPLAEPIAFLLMLGFFAGFAVKMPAFPFHTWLPDAYAESPTAATVILAALMAKTGGYGLLRFAVPLFPAEAHAFAPFAMALAVAGILYGAFLAFAQTDLKRIVAYSSFSHMGFVLLGVFAWHAWALQGAVMQMVAHGISTGALFILAGMLEARLRTRDVARMGGLWATVPRLSGLLLLFALAAMGLPGLGNFVAEFLVLAGTYGVSVPLTALAAVGVVLSVVYALWLVERTVRGPNKAGWAVPDLSAREGALMAVLVVLILWLGLAPQTVLSTAGQALDNLQPYGAVTRVVGASLAGPERGAR